MNLPLIIPVSVDLSGFGASISHLVSVPFICLAWTSPNSLEKEFPIVNLALRNFMLSLVLSGS